MGEMLILLIVGFFSFYFGIFFDKLAKDKLGWGRKQDGGVCLGKIYGEEQRILVNIRDIIYLEVKGKIENSLNF